MAAELDLVDSLTLRRPLTTNGNYGFEILKEIKQKEYRKKQEESKQVEHQKSKPTNLPKTKDVFKELNSVEYCCGVAEKIAKEKYCCNLAERNARDRQNEISERPFQVGRPVTTNGLYGFETKKKMLEEEYRLKQEAAMAELSERKQRQQRQAMALRAAKEMSNRKLNAPSDGSADSAKPFDILPPKTENHVYGFEVEKIILEDDHKKKKMPKRKRFAKVY